LLVLGLLSALTPFAIDMYLPSIPAIADDLHASVELVQLSVTVYLAVFAAAQLVMGLAPLVAPSVGGVIILYASWRWVFGALLIIALGAGLLFFLMLPETLQRQHRHALQLRAILANYGLLLRHRAALGYLLTGAGSFGGMMIFIVASPYVYIELHQVPAAWFGPLFGLNVLAAMLFAFLNSRLVPRLGAERLLRLGLAVQGLASLLLLAVALLPQPPLWVIALAAGSYISMAGIVMGNSMAGFMAFFPTMAGTASAFAGAVRFGFGALAGSVVSLLHDGSALPLLLGMGICGLAAVTLYRLLCCLGAPQGAAAMTEKRRAAADASVP
jgi:DHA1 family bicyclomycin/chloramphenicol resistance-like MFS transporter